jgi:hypothetical protein
MSKNMATPGRALVERARKEAEQPAYAHRLACMKAASRKIGATAASKLAWLVRFSAEDPSSWHPGERAEAGDCLLALARGRFPENLIGGVELPDPLPPGDVDDVHRHVHALLHKVVNAAAGEMVPVVTVESLEIGLVRLTFVGAKPAAWGVTSWAPSIRDATLHAVKDLIVQAGDRLIACRACTSPLIGDGKRTHCRDSACGQKARNDRKAEIRALTARKDTHSGKSTRKK